VARYAVPLADEGGRVAEHLGEAPLFAVVAVRLADGALLERDTLPNPHLKEAKAKGIRVAEWLVQRNVDAVYLKEDLGGKGPEYVFDDAGVEVRLTTADSLEEAVAQGDGP
jgi:predicted Fe-Mo cluster-binding NifX family protein